jgi:hypothetical protein
MMKHISENHSCQNGELRKWGYNYLIIKLQYEKLAKDREEGKDHMKHARKTLRAEERRQLKAQIAEN